MRTWVHDLLYPELRAYLVFFGQLQTHEQKLHLASADSAPGLENLVANIANVFGTADVDCATVVMDDNNTDFSLSLLRCTSLLLTTTSSWASFCLLVFVTLLGRFTYRWMLGPACTWERGVCYVDCEWQDRWGCWNEKFYAQDPGQAGILSITLVITLNGHFPKCTLDEYAWHQFYFRWILIMLSTVFWTHDGAQKERTNNGTFVRYDSIHTVASEQGDGVYDTS